MRQRTSFYTLSLQVLASAMAPRGSRATPRRLMASAVYQ